MVYRPVDNTVLTRNVGANAELVSDNDFGGALDGSSVLGVQGVQRNGAWVRMSTAVADDQRNFLESGESLVYRNAAGRECKISLLSVSGGESASFKTSCV